jgi:hypothetical protein
LVPTYHPAAALRAGPEVVAEMRADFVRAKRILSTGGIPLTKGAARPEGVAVAEGSQRKEAR